MKISKLIVAVCTLSVTPASYSFFDFNVDSSALEKIGKDLPQTWMDGLDLGCIKHEFKGGCVWLRKGFPPRIRYSTKARFYSPDAIVQVYHDQSKLPYGDMFAQLSHDMVYTPTSQLAYDTLSPVKVKLGNGSSSTSGFRSVSITGNPLFLLHQSLVGGLFESLQLGYCDIDIKPSNTYFHSDLDFLEWKAGLMETGLALANPFEYIQSDDYLTQWGTLYPRTGWTDNSSPFVGASVASLRAAHIVSGNQGSHIAMQLPSGARNAKNFSTPKVNLNEGRWKPFRPQPNSSCNTMPLPGVDALMGTNEPYTASRDYIFMLWRQYYCCRDRGRFIYDWHM